MNTAAKSDLRQEVTNAIIELLENPLKFENSWQMVKAKQPENPFTGTVYKGINFLNLSIVGMLRGYSVNRWLTFHEVRQFQARIKKGSRAASVCYYGTYEKTVVNPDTNCIEKEKQRILRSYNVFNVCDIEGLPDAYYQSEPLPTMEQWEKDEQAEQLLNRSGAKINLVMGNKACYNRLTDEITLPIREQFAGAEPFYSVAFHELTHWTGAANRLNRIKGKSFGDSDYAFEELVAELSAAFMCAHLGFQKEITNNAAYIKSWLKALKNDKSLIFKAAAEASKAADFIFDLSSVQSERVS